MNPPPRRLQIRCAIAGLALVAATMAAGCASTPEKPLSMRDPQVNFSAFKTFGWATEPKTGANGQPVSIADANLRAAIANELKRKGYEQAAAGTTPDLLVDFETAQADRIKSSPISIGVGVGSYGNSGGVGVGASSAGTRNVKEGKLVVRVVDAARKAEVWNGSVTRKLGKNNADPALVQRAVADVLQDFPARGGYPK